jgi:leucyl-tRNA synthetase
LADAKADGAAPGLASAFAEAAKILIQIMAPMMPHLAEECWEALGQTGLVAEAPWPEADRFLLVENAITLPVQVNGKKRADITVARDADQASIEAAVLSLDAVRRATEGRAVRKVIVVPQRIVNVVA